MCKLYQITHPEQTEQIELTEQTELTELTDIIVLTENLKKCELLTYSLSDNLKSRDASTSKKLNFKERKVICNDDCNYFDKKGRLKVKVVNRTDSLKQGI